MAYSKLKKHWKVYIGLSLTYFLFVSCDERSSKVLSQGQHDSISDSVALYSPDSVLVNQCEENNIKDEIFFGFSYGMSLNRCDSILNELEKEKKIKIFIGGIELYDGFDGIIQPDIFKSIENGCIVSGRHYFIHPCVEIEKVSFEVSFNRNPCLVGVRLTPRVAVKFPKFNGDLPEKRYVEWESKDFKRVVNLYRQKYRMSINSDNIKVFGDDSKVVIFSKNKFRKFVQTRYPQTAQEYGRFLLDQSNNAGMGRWGTEVEIFSFTISYMLYSDYLLQVKEAERKGNIQRKRIETIRKNTLEGI